MLTAVADGWLRSSRASAVMAHCWKSHEPAQSTTRRRRMISSRQLRPELLDTLAPDDPRAMRSRRDLRRINRLMATTSLIGAPLDRILRGSAVVRLVELGSGDGEVLLQLARRYARRWPKVSLELLDAQPVVSAQTLSRYRALGWDVQVHRADVFDWLATPAYGADA